MPQWLIDLLVQVDSDLTSQGFDPADVGYSTKRRMAILQRWPDHAVRAAEQDARLGDSTSLARYDQEVAAIKAALPKPVA